MVLLLQAKPSQNTPNFTFSSTVLVTHKTPFLARVLEKAFFIGFEKRNFNRLFNKSERRIAMSMYVKQLGVVMLLLAIFIAPVRAGDPVGVN